MSSAPRSGGTTRRAVLGAAAAGTAGLVLSPAFAFAGTDDPVVDWIDRTARPLSGIDPNLPDGDLAPLRSLAATAAIVGLGESAHTTHDEFVLKHRVAKFFAEHLGTRTIAWEEAWGSGVLIDRYVTEGVGDPAEIVRQSTFNLQNRALLDLMAWMRAFNEGRPRGRRIRFIGADVVQLREVQFTELERYVADVAPERSAELLVHLNPLRIQGSPGRHVGLYRAMEPAEQKVLITHAQAVHRLIGGLSGGTSEISPFSAEMHAYTLRGFYEANTADGDRRDIRDRYVADILDRWLRHGPSRDAGPILYSAANAHTVARPRLTVSFPSAFVPPSQWVTEHSMAGGLLRSRYGRRYVSLGITFDHGSILAGWETNQPVPVTIPAPPAGTVDHVLGQARRPDYLLDLRGSKPAAVRRWLAERGTLRIYSGAFYDAARDPDFHIATNAWGQGFDALLHLNTVQPTRLP